MSQENSTRGVLMFAHNNDEIDYFKLAYVNAKLIQKNLLLKAKSITVVTDQHSLDYAEKTIGKKNIKKAIGNIIVEDKDVDFKLNNQRTFKDTSQSVKQLSFYNKNRCDAYELSPYDETILIDADYLILSDALNACWNHSNDLMMSHSFKDIMSERELPLLDRLNPMGISMYWATVVYFRKTPFVETFFDIAKHVLENKTYYGNLYKWSGNIHRNDYSFSIAAHMVGGFTDCVLPELPVKLYKTFDTDDIHSVTEDLDLLLYLEKVRSPGDFILTRWSGVDLHIMNKWAINRVSDKILGALDAA